jgi:nucleoside-diphosphate-sugar epimerase
MSGRLFIFGLGYAGLAIARQARGAGWSVAATATTAEKVSQLATEGWAAELFAQPNASASEAFSTATHLLCTIPPDEQGDPVLRHYASSFERLKPRPVWLGYLSTTGVYGDTGGHWVDESAAPRPGAARSRYRLAAEQAWQALAAQHGLPLHIFRLPAIYGPGRSAIEQVRAGTARSVDKPGQVFSRIHVEDLARTVFASMERPAPLPGAIYNVADDAPAPQPEVIGHAARLLGVPAPPVVPWEQAAPSMSEMARSFYAENRRVQNDRIKRELGVVLKYPTYREGLAACLGGPPAQVS